MRVAEKHAPSKPGLSGEWAPTNANLWAQVLDVASGKKRQLTLGGRTINSPNNGRGYRNMPRNPMGMAWAAKQYNGFGGSWRRNKAAGHDQLHKLFHGAVTTTETGGVGHDEMCDLQRRGLVRLAGVNDKRHYWEITRSGARLFRAGLFDNPV